MPDPDEKFYQSHIASVRSRLSNLKRHSVTDEAVKARAHQISKLAPWNTDKENWEQAERELANPSPFAPLIALWRWSGFGEKSDKRGLDALISLSIPVLVFSGGLLFSYWSGERQSNLSIEERQESVLREYFREIKPILLDPVLSQDLRDSNTKAHSVARALTLTTLTQLRGNGARAGQRRSLVFQFLRESQAPLLAGANLSSYDLSDTDLSGTNLAKVNLSYANLRGANLYKTKLTGSIIYSINLRGAGLREADLRGVVFYAPDMQGADLSDANLTKALFYSPDLSRANLTKAILTNAGIYGGNLRGATLSGADLSNAYINNSDFEGANLGKTMLDYSPESKKYNSKSTKLVRATLVLVILRRANLAEVDFTGASINNADFGGATFMRTVCPNGIKTDRSCLNAY